MKRCLSCNASYMAPDWHCPACQAGVAQEGGIHLFAPSLANDNDGFDKESYARLAEVEDVNFWFRSRNALIVEMIKKYFPSSGDFLEIGCGTGYVLASLHKAFPDMRLVGTEIYSKGIGFAQKRLPEGAVFHQMDARAIPFTDEFDVIGAFDCLEHIEEDEDVLAEIYRALKPGGGAIFTVPQHAFLWSEADERACHKRRYGQGELQRKMKTAGFDILRTTSFVVFLFPLMVLNRKRKGGKQDEFGLPNWLNAVFSFVMMLERQLIRAGLDAPFGGSRLVVGRKPA